MGKLREIATGYDWEKIPNAVRVVMLEEDARIRSLEAKVAKADALAAVLEERALNVIGLPHDIHAAWRKYREGSDT